MTTRLPILGTQLSIHDRTNERIEDFINDERIQEIAKRHQIPIGILAAISFQETKCRNGEVGDSHSELGIIQVTPANIRDINSKRLSKGLSKLDPSNMYDAVELGATVWSGGIERCGGPNNYNALLRSYNGCNTYSAKILSYMVFETHLNQLGVQGHYDFSADIQAIYTSVPEADRAVLKSRVAEAIVRQKDFRDHAEFLSMSYCDESRRTRYANGGSFNTSTFEASFAAIVASTPIASNKERAIIGPMTDKMGEELMLAAQSVLAKFGFATPLPDNYKQIIDAFDSNKGLAEITIQQNAQLIFKLQGALGVEQDGIIGKRTRAAFAEKFDVDDNGKMELGELQAMVLVASKETKQRG